MILAALTDLAIAAPAAFMFGVLVGLALASRYRIVPSKPLPKAKANDEDTP